MRVSARFRDILRKRCQSLIESGINCFPRWVNSKAPAFRKGERYQKFMIQPLMDDEDFKNLVLKRFDDSRVGGISIVSGGAGGVLGIDYDPIKIDLSLWENVKKIIDEYGHIVYVDRRYGISEKGRLLKHGVHIILQSDKQFLTKHRIKIRHNFKAEFTVRRGLITVYPSVYIVTKGEPQFSVYLKLSNADILDAVYDEKTEILREIIEILGGSLQIAPITTERYVVSDEIKEPWHGFQDGRFLDSKSVWTFLKNFAKIERCEGLLRILESLEKRDAFPMTYFIYSDVVPNVDHPRSSWTIVENTIFRLLAEVGASEEAFREIRDAFKESEDKYRKVISDVAHETLDQNMEQTRRFNEHGHDKVGACIFKLAGLCYRYCTTTCWLKVKSSRDSIIKALHLALKGIELFDEAEDNA